MRPGGENIFHLSESTIGLLSRLYSVGESAQHVISEKEIDVIVNLNDGEFSATAFGCDLTYDYVKINGDYRT